MNPKKSLGQHWLNDTASLEAMCDAANIGPDDTVLEIGPGQGSLTRLLIERAKKVITVEKDEALAAQLSSSLSFATNLQNVRGDILEFDLDGFPEGYKVVANIPYYLTSHLLRKLCEAQNPFSRAALLVQKEVAQRVCAKHGDMSLLSVSVQFYCHVSLGEVVAAYLFEPPPKVDSQILKLDYRGPMFENVNIEQFFNIVRAGFGERRKKLRSSLSSGLKIGKADIERMLAVADISPDRRAQELSLDDWYNIYRSYKPI